MEKELDEAANEPLASSRQIFACRKMSSLDGKPSLAREMAFRDSIDLAAEMMQNAGEVAERLKAAVC